MNVARSRTRSAITVHNNDVVTRKHRPDYQIILFSGILLLLSVVVLFSISPARVAVINLDGYTLDEAHFMQHQVLYLLAGLAGFSLAAAIPLNIWNRLATKLLLVAFGLCFVLIFLGLVHSPLALCTNGACRWFNLGFSSFQPAELLKFALLIFTAGFLGMRMQQGKVNSISDTIIPLAIVVMIATIFIIGAQKDMGTGVTLFGIITAMLVVAGVKFRLLFMACVTTVAIGILFIVTSPHRMERVATFFDASKSGATNSYHIDQASIAIGSGGLTGVGLGKSIQAFGYVPEAQNDSIFAILGEIFGFIGLLGILAIFYALFTRILLIVDTVIDSYTKLLVAGIFGWLATHTAVNIGAMIGVFPLTGITLPFLSFGGTSLLFTMIILGLVFQASKFTTHRARQVNTLERGNNAHSHSRRGIGRSRYASSRSY